MAGISRYELAVTLTQVSLNLKHHSKNILKLISLQENA
jgi:hypothetical protein